MQGRIELTDINGKKHLLKTDQIGDVIDWKDDYNKPENAQAKIFYLPLEPVRVSLNVLDSYDEIKRKIEEAEQ